jgi:hypothetical protein
MSSLGQSVARIFRLKPSRPPIVLSPAATAEIQQARDFLKTGCDDLAFAALNQIKARLVPVRDADYLRAFCFLGQNHNGAAREALQEELRWFPDHEAAQSLLRLLRPPDQAETSDPEFRELFQTIRPYTMLSQARLFSLYNLAKAVCRENLPGNFVECGVAGGGSSALLAAVISRHSAQPRQIFSFDTFSGMPPSSERDTHAGATPQAIGWGEGTCAAPESSLLEVSAKLGVANIVQPVRGLFSDTLPVWREKIGPIPFLHMDSDWYSSTRDILTNLFDSVVPGGRIQIDDYGFWEGCRRAVEEFAAERRLAFRLAPIDESGVWLVK